MSLDAIVISEKDNVATAVHLLQPNETVKVTSGIKEITAPVRQEIPFGHKLALREIPAGGDVIKYGETIGRATASISPGEHVHVHNVEGLRGRGDKA